MGEKARSFIHCWFSFDRQLVLHIKNHPKISSINQNPTNYPTIHRQPLPSHSHPKCPLLKRPISSHSSRDVSALFGTTWAKTEDWFVVCKEPKRAEVMMMKIFILFPKAWFWPIPTHHSIYPLFLTYLNHKLEFIPSCQPPQLTE